MHLVFRFPLVTLCTTQSDLIYVANLDIVDRVLREANIKKWLAKSRPKLKPQHIAKRLNWATVYKNWTVEDFEGVI